MPATSASAGRARCGRTSISVRVAAASPRRRRASDPNASWVSVKAPAARARASAVAPGTAPGLSLLTVGQMEMSPTLVCEVLLQYRGPGDLPRTAQSGSVLEAATGWRTNQPAGVATPSGLPRSGTITSSVSQPPPYTRGVTADARRHDRSRGVIADEGAAIFRAASTGATRRRFVDSQYIEWVHPGPSGKPDQAVVPGEGDAVIRNDRGPIAPDSKIAEIDQPRGESGPPPAMAKAPESVGPGRG